MLGCRPGLKPVLLVTCRTGRSSWCREEVGDVLFEIDPDVNVVETGFPDVLLVCSKLDVNPVYNRARGSEYGFVENIIPVHGVLRDPGGLGEVLGRLVSAGEKVKVRVRALGVRGLSTRVWAEAVSHLKGMGAVVDRDAEVCVHVVLLKDAIIVGKAPCKPVFK